MLQQIRLLSNKKQVQKESVDKMRRWLREENIEVDEHYTHMLKDRISIKFAK